MVRTILKRRLKEYFYESKNWTSFETISFLGENEAKFRVEKKWVFDRKKKKNILGKLFFDEAIKWVMIFFANKETAQCFLKVETDERLKAFKRFFLENK